MSAHLCPLCHSPTRKYEPYSYEKVNPHLHVCTSCYFRSDIRLLDALGLVTNPSSYTVFSDYEEISADPDIDLLPYSDIRARLRTLDPDPQVTVLNWPDNPSSGGPYRSRSYYYSANEPAHFRNQHTFTLHRLVLPLFLGTDPEALRRLSRRLGPLQVPGSFTLPTDRGDELFFLKSPPTGCTYPVVTCNPRAAKARNSLTSNTLTRARNAAADYPLPPPSHYTAALSLLPFPQAANLTAHLNDIETRAASTEPKKLAVAVHRARDNAATYTLTYLCLLLHNTRLPPQKIDWTTNAFTYTPLYTRLSTPLRPMTSRSSNWSNWTHDHYHSPCARWWKRNPEVAAALLTHLAPLYDPHLNPSSDEVTDNPNTTAHRERIGELTLDTPTLFFLFRRLRLIAGSLTPTNLVPHAAFNVKPAPKATKALTRIVTINGVPL